MYTHNTHIDACRRRSPLLMPSLPSPLLIFGFRRKEGRKGGRNERIERIERKEGSIGNTHYVRLKKRKDWKEELEDRKDAKPRFLKRRGCQEAWR